MRRSLNVHSVHEASLVVFTVQRRRLHLQQLWMCNQGKVITWQTSALSHACDRTWGEVLHCCTHWAGAAVAFRPILLVPGDAS